MGGIIQLVYVMLSNKSFYVYLALGHGNKQSTSMPLPKDFGIYIL